MKTITKYKITLLMLFSMLLLPGCGDDTNITAPDVSKQGNGDVILSLNVSVSNSKGVTRAFENAENPFEKIHSLRVIIVNAKDTVEHNVRVDMPDGTGVDKIGELEFKVSTKYGTIDHMLQTEKKRIYLIANEDAIPSGKDLPKGMVDIRQFLEEDLKPGKQFFQSSAKYIVIWNNWQETSGNAPTLPEYASPFIDNEEGSDKTYKYVLMSEFFDVNVTSNLTIPGEQKTEANLFITRNLVKFRFSIRADEDTPSFQVKKITFSNLMQKEYLFPNETIYDPPKYDADEKVYIADREITSFETPSYSHGDGNYVRPYIFEPANFGFNAKSSTTSFTDTYEPNLYFCETKNLVKSNTDDTVTDSQLYTVGIEVEFLNKLKDDDGNEIIDPFVLNFDAKQLENLKLLPRNTIVQVDMVVHKGVLEATATVYPYTGVFLNPEFGFSTPQTDHLVVENVGENLFKATYLRDDKEIDKIDDEDINLIWVSKDPSILLLEPAYNDYPTNDNRYFKPADSIERPVTESIRVVPQSSGKTTVTVYSQTGLVATIDVTVNI